MSKSIAKKAYRQRYYRLNTWDRLLSFKNISLCVMSAICLTWVVVWIVSISNNFQQIQVEYSEGFIIYLSELFNAGEFNYQISDIPPYMVSFYTPLFYLIYGNLIEIFNNTWLVGRIFVLALTVGCMVLVYLIVYRISRHRVVSIISALLPATQYIIIQWSIIIRVDILGAFFELAAIYIALRFWKSPGIYLSIPLFLLAFYTKQSFFVGAFAVFIALAFENWRRALIYTGIIGSILLATLGTAYALTDGQFLVHLIEYQKTYPLFKPLQSIISYDLISYYPLLPVIFIGGLYAVFNRKNVLTIFAVLAIILNLVLLCRGGAAQNYQFEVIFAFCIIGGLGIQYVIKQKSWVYILVIALNSGILLTADNFISFPDADYQAKYRQAVELISDTDYPVLSENCGIVVDAGETPYLIDPFMFMHFSHYGYFDESKIIEDLRQNKIDYVILQNPLPQIDVVRFTMPVQQEIMNNYHIVIDNYTVDSYGFLVYQANTKIAE